MLSYAYFIFALLKWTIASVGPFLEVIQYTHGTFQKSTTKYYQVLINWPGYEKAEYKKHLHTAP